MENEEKTNNNKSKKGLIIGIVVCVIVAILVAGVVLSQNKGGEAQTNNAVAENEKKIAMNQAFSVDGKVEMTIVSNKIVDKIEPPSPTGVYTYFDAKEGNKYVDVVADVKNLSDSAVKQNSLFTAKAYIDNNEYDCLIVTEKENGANLNQYITSKDINALETIKYHIAAKVSKELVTAGKSVKFVITVNEEKYVYEINIIDDESQKQEGNSSTINLSAQGKEIKKSQLVKADGICEFKIVKTKIASKIEPPSPSGIYTYYKADSGKVYFDLVADIKNLRKESIKQSTVIGKVTLVYDGEYEYDCGCVVEKENGSNFNGYPNLYDIKPLETMRYHIMAQVPKEVSDSKKKIDIKISIDGEDYIYHAR